MIGYAMVQRGQLLSQNRHFHLVKHFLFPENLLISSDKDVPRFHEWKDHLVWSAVQFKDWPLNKETSDLLLAAELGESSVESFQILVQSLNMQTMQL